MSIRAKALTLLIMLKNQTNPKPSEMLDICPHNVQRGDAAQ
jgi:hypothetical protein